MSGDSTYCYHLHTFIVRLLCFLLLTGFIYCTLFACTKNGSGQSDIAQKNLPSTIGSRWVYLVSDSLYDTTDTLTILISGTTVLKNGASAKIIKSYSVFSPDTVLSYLVENNERAIYYLTQEATDFNKIYLFPLTVGKSWIGENQLDTNKVISNQDINVHAGTFSTFTIARDYKVTNSGIREKEWFCQGIGMIQRDYYERNVGFVIFKHFELLSYSIMK